MLWVGIGCKRGTPKAAIEQAIQDVFRSHQLAESAIAGIATIDTKANEAGLVEFCRDRNLPLRYFPAGLLRSVAIPNPSGAIDAAIGTPSVAEAAALLACWERGGGVEEWRSEGRSGEREKWENSLPSLPLFANPQPPTPNLCVSKQIFRPLGQAGLVTVAVARSSIVTHRSPQITFRSHR